MADKTPIRVVVDGSGNTTGLSEFQSGETLGLSHGGTGATTASAARTSLGLHAVATSGSYTDLLNKPTTDDISEGSTNLYYTNARVAAYLNSNSYVVQSYVDTALSNILDGAPGVLDTLNELAAAIGDDANFATTIQTQIAQVQTNLDANFGSKTTDDLAEGISNLYYTDARVRSHIQGATLAMGSNDITTTGKVLFANMYQNEINLPNANNQHGMFAHVHNTGKGYFAHGGYWRKLLDESSSSTSDLSEGSNLYFTNERVDDRVSTLIVGGLNLTSTYNDVSGTLTLDVDNSGGFDLASNSTSDLQEGSNLYYTDSRVLSYVTTLNYVTQSYVDNVINPISSQFSGILSDLDDEIFDRETADTEINTTISNLTTTDIAEGTNLYYTNTRARGSISVTGDLTYNSTTGVISTQGLASSTTDDLSEGSTNLYYTDSRARTAIDGQIVKFANMYSAEVNLPSATTYHGMFAHVHGTGKGYFAHAGNWIKLLDESSSDTSDLSEGTNLYYTESRTDARIALQVGASLDLSNKTTSDLSEGTNLYYTQARFDSAFTAKSTTNLSEGTNLYFTNARVQTKLGDVSGHIIPDTDVSYDLGSSTHKFRDLYLSGSSIILGTIELKDNGGVLEQIPVGGGTTLTYATQTYVTTQIANLVDTAPTTLDTLNELAAALGDDANFSTTITNSIATKLAITDFTSTANTWVGTKSTSDLSEGTNLYYTDSRTDTRIGLQVGASLDLSNKSTTDLTEGTNLYYTDVRALAATDGQIVKFANMYATEGNLPSATTYHGMFAHVHGTGKGYFAHAGNWIKLLDESSSTTSDLSEGTNLYYTDARVDVRISSANIGDLGNVNLTNAPTDGQTIVWDNTNSEFIAGDAAGFTQSDFDTAFTAKSTTDLSEGTNLYYTDARADARVNANTASIISDLDDEIFDRETADADLQTQINAISSYSDADVQTFLQGGTYSGTIVAPSFEGKFYDTNGNVIIDNTSGSVGIGANTFSGDLTGDVTGNLTGNTTGIHTGNVTGDLDGYVRTTQGNVLLVNTHGAATFGGQSDTVASLSNLDSDNLSEGTTNLYYTDARVQTKLGDVSGNIIPDTDVTYDLGSSTYKFRDLYLSGSTIHLGSIELSDNGGDLEVTPIAGGSTSTFATTTYVTTAIANLVDTAPTTLDTLNELAAALGDDANFASTVTTSLGTKLNLSGGTMTGALDMGSNNVTTTGKMLYANMYASEGDLPSATTYHGMFAHVHATGKGYFAHAGSWIKLLDESSSTTTDITEGTNLYYTDARVRSHITGADLDMGSNDITTTGKMLYANMYAAEANLPSATTYHGMFAHVHGTGKGYFAHAGSWIKLLDESSSTTTNLSEGTNLYYTDARVRSHITGAALDMGSNNITTTGKMLFANIYATIGDLPSATTYHGMFAHVHGTGKGYFAHAGNWVELANNSQIIAQDFSYASLTGAPTIPTSINNLTDVDIYTTAPTNGQTLVWDNANNKFIPGAASGGGSYDNAAVDTHLNQSNPTSGYVLSWNGSDYAWVAQSGGGGGAATLQVSDAAPSSPTANDLWLNSTNMKLFVYYADGSSNQWVEVGAGGTISGGGGGGSSVTVSDAAPSSPADGDMWFNSTDTKLYIYYNDGSSSQWVQALPSGGSGGGSSSSSNTWVEKTSAYTVVAGEKLLVDCSSAAVTVTLPATAALGDEIRIIDATGNSSTNNITIARNGHKIQGAADNLTINTDRAAFGLVYYNAAQGWLLTER